MSKQTTFDEPRSSYLFIMSSAKNTLKIRLSGFLIIEYIGCQYVVYLGLHVCKLLNQGEWKQVYIIIYIYIFCACRPAVLQYPFKGFQHPNTIFCPLYGVAELKCVEICMSATRKTLFVTNQSSLSPQSLFWSFRVHHTTFISECKMLKFPPFMSSCGTYCPIWLPKCLH